MDPPHKTLTLTVPNGFLKKHYHHHQLIVYRECLKNHAASLGGHSLDGCGEFMASPSSNPSDPTSLTCAACGCHRNFHRRLPHQHLPEEDDSEDGDDEDVGNYNGETSSAPHMLMALSAAVGTTAEEKVGPTGGRISRKRFRTRFSAEQKEGMLQLSERLGWRMQKKDDAVVEDRCRELGVGRGVFKVWMHNNKHNFVPSPRAPAVAVAVASPPPPPPPPNVSSLALPTVSKGGGGDARVNGSGSAAMDTN